MWFFLNVILFKPPKEEINWSCLPIGALILLISISQDNSANFLFEILLPLFSKIALIRALVKLLEDPSPVPDGMSAKAVISIWFKLSLNFLIVSLKILWFTSLIFFTFSLFEYFK